LPFSSGCVLPWEEFFMDEQVGKKTFFQKWGWLIVLGLALLAIGFLFTPLLTYVTRVKNGDEKIDTSHVVNIVTLMTNSSITHVWYGILTFAIFCIATILVVVGPFTKKAKDGLIVGGIFAFLIGICMLFLNRELFDYYALNGKDWSPMIENYHKTKTAWGAGVSISFASLACLLSLGLTSYGESITVRSMAEDGVLIAFAFVLNFVKLPIQAEGGSVNFQMLPLMLIALRHGPAQGFICGGLIYGLLTCLTDGYGLATYPFDYLIGFGSVAVMGFFRSKIFVPGQKKYTVKGEFFLLLAGVLATLIRYIGSTVSSIVLYAYTLKAALAYNIVYIPVSGAISLALIMALYGPLCRLNTAFPVKTAKKEEAGEQKAQ